MRLLLKVSAVLGLAIGLVTPAHAVQITNQTTGEVLFYDNLELDTPGTTPDAAHIGFWTSIEGFDEVVTGGTPGAFEGVNYLRTRRTAAGVGNAYAHIPLQSTAGDEIHVEFMMYLPSGSDAAPILTGDDQLYRLLLRAAGTRIFYYDGDSYELAGLSYTSSTWQKWQIDYMVGETTATVTIGTNSAIVPTLQDLATPGGGGVGGFLFAHNALNSYWVDAVPAAAPPNDSCASAIPVTAGAHVGTTLGATNDGSASCGNSNASPDVWYSYTAECTGELSADACGAVFDTVLSVHSGCPGTTGNELPSGCNEDCGGTPCGGSGSCVTVPVVSGNTYWIRASGVNGAQGYFTLNLACNPPPANDDCADAQPIGPGVVAGTTLGASNDGGASCDPDGSADVWYSYTAGFTGQISLDLCGSPSDTALSVHSPGCPGTAGTELACNDDCGGAPCGGGASCLLVPVVSGNTYLIRVVGAKAAKADFTLTLLEPPANETCATAQTLTDGTITGSTVVATNDGSSSCGDSATSPDVWYSYTATCTGELLAETCGSGYDTVVSVHTGCPGSAGNEVTSGCNDECGGAPCGGPSSCVRTPVVSGNTYKIRVSGASGASGSFVLDVSCMPAPPNDDCADAVPVSDGAYTGTTAGSSDDGSASCGAPGAGDVWYTYTAPTTGELLASTCDSSYDTLISIHSGCPGTVGNELASGCNDDCAGAPCGGPTSCLVVPVEGGNTYWIRVSGAAGQKGDFSMQIRFRPPHPLGALLIENLTTAELLFVDDFELAFAGGAPQTDPPGYWTSVPVLDFVTADAVPGPFDGTQYLSTTRTSTAVGNPVANFTPQSTTGDLIHFEFGMYLPTGTDMGVLLTGDTTTYRAIIRAGGLGQGTVADYAADTGYVEIADALYTPDKWEKWEIDYVIGATTCSVRIDNGTAFNARTLHDLYQGGGGVINLSFSHNALATFYVDAVPPPANDTCEAATAIPEGYFRGTTSRTTNDGSSSCGVTGTSPDVWYSYTASCTGDLRVNTCGSELDTVLSTHSDTCPGTAQTELGSGCSDDCGGFPCSGPGSCLTLPVTAGNTYLMRVSGANDATGRFNLNVLCGPPPANDDCNAAIAIGEETYQGTTLQCTNDGEASCDPSLGPDVYYLLTSACDDTLEITATSPYFNPITSVHDASWGCPVDAFTEFGCGSDGTPVYLPSSTGQQLLVRVGGQSGTSGNFTLSASCVTEVCNNGVDDDGDQLVDCADPDCNADLITTDVDKDGDVDLADFTVFQECFTTAGNPYPGPPDVQELCPCLDKDQDLDVDLIDYTKFGQCFNGPDQPPGC